MFNQNWNISSYLPHLRKCLCYFIKKQVDISVWKIHFFFCISFFHIYNYIFSSLICSFLVFNIKKYCYFDFMIKISKNIMKNISIVCLFLFLPTFFKMCLIIVYFCILPNSIKLYKYGYIIYINEWEKFIWQSIAILFYVKLSNLGLNQRNFLAYFVFHWNESLKQSTIIMWKSFYQATFLIVENLNWISKFLYFSFFKHFSSKCI